MSLFGNKHESNLRSALHMVEEAMAALGPEFAFEPLGAGTHLSWTVRKGAIEIHATLRTRDEGNYLRVVAPLPRRPAVEDATFYRRLLELNGRELSGAAFAIIEGELSLCSERTTVDLDQSEILDVVRRIAEYVERFGSIV